MWIFVKGQPKALSEVDNAGWTKGFADILLEQLTNPEPKNRSLYALHIPW